ncbi:MAG: Uma2 family endonuclease [Acidobacteria bacterium]|nr:Uma2 family endonuclease [Acidobacteriota bacterium]
MAIPAPRSLMTAEGLLELPDDGYRYELVDGYLVRMTPAGGEHGVVTARVGKIAEYFAAGTRLVWIVEPATRRVHVYRSLHGVQVLEEDGELTGGDVLPGFRCAVKRLFPA